MTTNFSKLSHYRRTWWNSMVASSIPVIFVLVLILSLSSLTMGNTGLGDDGDDDLIIVKKLFDKCLATITSKYSQSFQDMNDVTRNCCLTLLSLQSLQGECADIQPSRLVNKCQQADSQWLDATTKTCQISLDDLSEQCPIPLALWIIVVAVVGVTMVVATMLCFCCFRMGNGGGQGNEGSDSGGTMSRLVSSIMGSSSNKNGNKSTSTKASRSTKSKLSSSKGKAGGASGNKLQPKTSFNSRAVRTQLGLPEHKDSVSAIKVDMSAIKRAVM